MKTLYAACLARLGLSQSEAADLHRSRIDTVKAWSSGRNPVPDGVWADLRGYESDIVDRSEAIRDAWEDSGKIRELEVSWDRSRANLMALADFALSTDAAPPVKIFAK